MSKDFQEYLLLSDYALLYRQSTGEIKMITVYSKNNCMQCKMVKKWLTEHSVDFNEINIDEKPEFVQTVIDMGFRAAPVVTKGDFAFSGFNPSELVKLA